MQLGLVGTGLLLAACVRGGPEGGMKLDMQEIKPYQTLAGQMKFRAGEIAAVIASSRGGTDVDLYVFDEAGNLVAWDDSPLDACAVEWLPDRAARFSFVVHNTGLNRDVVEIVFPAGGGVVRGERGIR
jgi:hypothetical protein